MLCLEHNQIFNDAKGAGLHEIFVYLKLLYSRVLRYNYVIHTYRSVFMRNTYFMICYLNCLLCF